MKKPNVAVLAAISQNKPRPNEDRLRLLRDRVRAARDLEMVIEDLETQVAERRKELTKIVGGSRDEPGELNALFEELGISSISLDAEGNVPAFDAEVKTFYSASIPKDPDKASAALDHIERVWKMPDLIKTSLSADFGRGERAKAKDLEKFLKKNKLEYSSKVGVHAQTLTAEVRRRFESGKPLSPKELSTIGGFVGTTVKLSKRKED